MKKYLSFLLALLLLFFTPLVTAAQDTGTKREDAAASPFTVEASSAVLMEASSGEILFAQNADAAYPPASVTKIMTLLLVAEALREGKIALTESVTVSAHAASMGGSQVFLREGESLTVEELLKCTVIASANDAALALAEHVLGSESAFVARMNLRAAELGMKSTHFENVTGLDDSTQNHVTSAKDIAIMSRELLQHEVIRRYSSLWQDSIRDGAFVLTNTNRLVRYYPGCNGLKTGSTVKAGYCISASAQRDGMQLIAVIMGAQSRDTRNAAARTLLDYGFGSFAVYKNEGGLLERASVLGGTDDEVALSSRPFSAVIDKAMRGRVELTYEIPQSLRAPIAEGEVVGRIVYHVGDETLGESEIYASQSVDKITLIEIFRRILRHAIE